MPPLLKNSLISSAAMVLVVLAFAGPVDTIGSHYTATSLKRALVTFGIARGLNAVISVAQGTEVAMEPAGVGVVFTPGQILDPVNDLVERFSWVMLLSSSSLGLQGLLLKIFSSPVFTVLLALLVGLALLLIWWRRPVSANLRTVVFRLAGLLLILRFLLPMLAISSEAFYSFFLAPEYQASSTYLTETQQAVSSLNTSSRTETSAANKLTWYQRLQGNVKGALDAVDMEKQVAAMQQAVENLSEHIINLVVVFILQTILFPLLFLWLAMKAARAVFHLRWTKSTNE